MNEIYNNTLALEAEARSNTTSQERLKELATINNNLTQIVAENIETSPELLVKLASHKSKAVRQAVASNPNTPTETLFDLSICFPKEFLNNPIFELLLLEDSQFIKKIPTVILSILIQQNNVPQLLLNYAANHRDKKVADIAKMHISLSGEITKGWHQAVEEMIQDGSFVDKFILDFHGAIFIFNGMTTSYKNDPAIPRQSYKLLANFCELIESVISKNYQFKNNTALNPNTPPEILKKLAQDGDRHLRESVGGNPSTPVEVLELFANDSDLLVREWVSQNPKCTFQL